jgi:hypothetical protein
MSGAQIGLLKRPWERRKMKIITTVKLDEMEINGELVNTIINEEIEQHLRREVRKRLKDSRALTNHVGEICIHIISMILTQVREGK